MNHPPAAVLHPPARTMFGPWADVLLLGGGSVIAMLVLGLIRPTGPSLLVLASSALILANFINHPHFAYSYQIFYGSWSEVKQGAMAPDLSRRWWLAGVIVPIVLALALAACVLLGMRGNYVPLAWAGFLMGLLVGWHYVKQGFGMAMVDAALKKCYWPAESRRALLYNAYACWAAAWAVATSLITSSNVFWGIAKFSLGIPSYFVAATCAVAAASTVWCVLSVVRCLQQWHKQGRSWQQMPLAGLVAYLITLYLWMGLLSHEPAFALFIPAFHSLQYLTVIARYKANEAKQQQGMRLLPFVLKGAVLGALGFWLLPGAADYLHTGQIPEFNGTPFVFIAAAWIFINVHHYFIDNVLWRQGNPKVKQFLFDS